MTPASLYENLVPAPLSPRVDWQLITEQFAWFRALEGCPQDPIYHSEGNVMVHTRMVVEALLDTTDWRQLPSVDRRLLFWATLLHDVGKPSRSRVESNGRITAFGHSRKGQILARRILWQMGAPFGERERVCHLITHHQLPFFLIDLDEPERRIHLISYQTRCDLLTIHAHADARGRIARDLSQILDNIALFHALCEEQGCLHSPRRFASDHSRFLYFRKEGVSVDHEAYDDWENRVTLMSGLPASGKDLWIAANATQKDVISLDALRATLGVAPWQPQGAVIVAARERAREALRAGRTFVWNATNLSRHLRGTLIDLCAAYRAKVDIVYVETSSEELARRNSARTEPVPSKANERMFERWEVPDLTECHTLQTALS